MADGSAGGPTTGEMGQQKPNPYVTANPLSKLFFSWVTPIFRKVYKNKKLPTQDLFGILPNDSSESCGNEIEKEWNKELEKKQPSLVKALLRVYGLYYASLGIFALTEEAMRVAQPIILGYLIDYFSPVPTNPIEEWQAYCYAAGVSLLSLLLAIVHAPYCFAIQRLGMKIRVGLCTMVYRKMLKLSNTSMRETSGGQINNFMTNDVNRFDRLFMFLHYLWLGPLEVVIIGALLYREIQWAFIPGYIVLFLLMPTHAFLGRIFGVLRRKTAVYTDKRVGIMSEIIMAMRVIKMYAWEQPFEMVVRKIRKSEIAKILLATFPQAFNMCLGIYGNRLFDVFMIITYALNAPEIKASTIFVVIAYCNTLRGSFSGMFPQAFQFYFESRISLKRIQKFLLLDELEAEPIQKAVNGDVVSKPQVDNPGITAVNLQGSWEADKSNPVLQFLQFEVPKGNLMAVVGLVGSGKSSLLMALLKELPGISGKASVQGRISYVSQEPWVFSGTVRQNILFGKDYEETRYKRIIRVCALDKDIAQLADGDSTMVGERGVTLSGGQKARVNLARALYDDADVYLLDDPLSAVDSEVGRHIFDRCIMGYLQDKPRILVTHQVQFLSSANQILVLKEGRQEALGTLNELQAQGIDFTKLLKEDDDEDEDDDGWMSPRPGSIRSRTGSGKSRTGSIKEKKELESAKMFKAEEVKKGDVTWSTYLKYFSSGTNICGLIILFFFLLGSQVVYILADYFLAYWADTEEAARLIPEMTTPMWATTPYMTTPEHKDSLNDWDFTTEESAFIYGFLVVLLLIMGLVRAFLAFRVMITASKNLHYKMFKSVVRSPVLFFDTNPTGRILNRFTKDIGLMDDQLPTTFFDFAQLALLILGVVIINVIVNPFIILLAVPLGVIFVILRRYSLVTTRQVKRLDGVTRSPVFSHTTSSLKGIYVIRSYHKQDKFNAEFCKHQDLHSEAWYMFLATQRWFGLRLDLIMVIFTCGITIGAVPVADFLDAGLVGLILSNTLSLTNVFQFCVRQSALVENQMTSVERVMEYCKLQSEAPLEIPQNKPDTSWPQSGNINFQSLSLAYSNEMPIVLKDINCQIQAKEKIGVVGRTGAGKSSIITALFRLAEPHGAIIIDGIKTSNLGLHDLRMKLSIIPQDPVLFTGTLRYNLDPFDEHNDASLWKAMEEVQLNQVVKESPEKLEMQVGEGGSNFSVGQRQLICLARAILKHNRILILDEATANVDPRTDALIQETIRSKFQKCTVITIAHRLNTIMDSDRIMVLDNGELKEFEQPYMLLQDKTSPLSKLVEQTGKAVSAQLLEVAQTHYMENDSTMNGSTGCTNVRSQESLQDAIPSSPGDELALRKSNEIHDRRDDDSSPEEQPNNIDTRDDTTLHKDTDEDEKQSFENAGFEKDDQSDDEDVDQPQIEKESSDNAFIIKDELEDNLENEDDTQQKTEKQAFDNAGFVEDDIEMMRKEEGVAPDVDTGVCSDVSSDNDCNTTAL